MHLNHVMGIILLIACALVQAQSFSLSPPPFQRFTFAPNNVCIKPQHFVATKEDVIGEFQNLEFTMRNVPGEGDCMFLAVALATSTSMGLGGNDALLRSIADETRSVVAQVLSSSDGNFHVEGKRIVRASDLLLSAARKEGLEREAYIKCLREGKLQGGGPELTVLSNVLRRPISIYELEWDEEKYQGTVPDMCQLKCMGSFGDIFKDPLAEIPNSAVTCGLQQGAYSWHIHILVVDSGAGENHSCALLPKACYI